MRTHTVGGKPRQAPRQSFTFNQTMGSDPYRRTKTHRTTPRGDLSQVVHLV